MYGIVLIAVLVVMGGAIAVIGDRVGSKVGKKKLSLFGLRPRHTSVIVTIATGILITMLTFAVMAAASENVRVALFGMEKLNAEMAETRERLEAEGKKLAEAEQAQKKAAEELQKSQGEVEALQKTQAELETRTQALALGNAQLEDAKNALTAQNEELTASNADLAVQNGTLSEENRALEKRTEALRDGLLLMREGDISFRAGEVLASGVVRGSRPVEEVREDLGALIQLANMNAAGRLEMEPQEGLIWIYTPEFDQAAETISAGSDEMVVRIVAAGNLVRGEPVHTGLQLFKNQTIYEADEFILSRSFTFTSGETGEAEGIVMSFLQEVNAAARAKGILPDPIRGSVGVMESSQFYEVVQKITAIRGDGVLSARAREETGSIGPLRLKLYVEAADAPRAKE